MRNLTNTRKRFHATKSSSQPYLTKEESEFAEFFMYTAKAGYGKSRKQVKTLAENVARDKGVLGTDENISKLVVLLFYGEAR